jgi:hypothetical protein
MGMSVGLTGLGLEVKGAEIGGTGLEVEGKLLGFGVTGFEVEAKGGEMELHALIAKLRGAVAKLVAGEVRGGPAVSFSPNVIIMR